MSEPFLISKAIDFSTTALGKATSIVIKGLLVLAVIACMCFGLWSAYVTAIKPHTKPNPTTTQKAERIENYTIQPKQTLFGCQHFQIVGDKPIVENKSKVK